MILACHRGRYCWSHLGCGEREVDITYLLRGHKELGAVCHVEIFIGVNVHVALQGHVLEIPFTIVCGLGDDAELDGICRIVVGANRVLSVTIRRITCGQFTHVAQSILIAKFKHINLSAQGSTDELHSLRIDATCILGESQGYIFLIVGYGIGLRALHGQYRIARNLIFKTIHVTELIVMCVQLHLSILYVVDVAHAQLQELVTHVRHRGNITDISNMPLLIYEIDIVVIIRRNTERFCILRSPSIYRLDIGKQCLRYCQFRVSVFFPEEWTIGQTEVIKYEPLVTYCIAYSNTDGYRFTCFRGISEYKTFWGGYRKLFCILRITEIS